MERYKCIKLYPNGPDVGEHAIQTNIKHRFFELEEDPEAFPSIDDPASYPDVWERVDKEEVSLINGVYFDLRDNADIISLAIEASKSLDSTPLKKYFKEKLEL